MRIAYGRDTRPSRYWCSYARKQTGAPVCQSFGARKLEQAVEELLLECLTPLGIEAMIEAAKIYEHDSETERTRWNPEYREGSLRSSACPAAVRRGGSGEPPCSSGTGAAVRESAAGGTENRSRSPTANLAPRTTVERFRPATSKAPRSKTLPAMECADHPCAGSKAHRPVPDRTCGCHRPS